MRFQGLFGTPDTIRTCDLQSRSFQAHPDKMLCFQGLYGFYRKHPVSLNFLKTIENTGKIGFFGFADGSSQTVVRILLSKEYEEHAACRISQAACFVLNRSAYVMHRASQRGLLQSDRPPCLETQTQSVRRRRKQYSFRRHSGRASA